MNKKIRHVIQYGLLVFALWFLSLMVIRLYFPQDWSVIQHLWKQQVRSQDARFHISKES